MLAQRSGGGSATTFAALVCACAVSPGNQLYRECAAPPSAVCGERAVPACVRILRTSPAAPPLPRRSPPAPGAPDPGSLGKCLPCWQQYAARIALPHAAPVAPPGNNVLLAVARVPVPRAFARGQICQS